MPDQRKYDVIIIGGSYAGLSAAMALGRSLKEVLIIDSGLPYNRQTPNSPISSLLHWDWCHSWRCMGK